jgi:hypothetical protein
MVRVIAWCDPSFRSGLALGGTTPDGMVYDLRASLGRSGVQRVKLLLPLRISNSRRPLECDLDSLGRGTLAACNRCYFIGHGRDTASSGRHQRLFRSA